LKRRGEIDALHLFPHRVGGFGDGRPASKSAEQVHQHIQPAIAFHNFCDAALDLIQFVEIDCHCLEIRLRKVRRLDAQRCTDNARSLLQKRVGDGGTEPSIGASDEHDLISHRWTSFSGPQPP
jgi:hypothetical protein